MEPFHSTIPPAVAIPGPLSAIVRPNGADGLCLAPRDGSRPIVGRVAAVPETAVELAAVATRITPHAEG